MEIGIDTSQFKILEDYFNDLDHLDKTKVIMSSFRRAAKPLVRQIIANTPIGETYKTVRGTHFAGNLRRSIGTTEVPYRPGISIGYRRSGLAKGWYALWLEEGTKERLTRGRARRKIKGGLSRGKLTANHMFERAYDAMINEVDKIYHDDFYAAVERFRIKAVNKLKK